jgi:hypothetical protein
METPLLNFIDSSFEHVLHSYGLHLISTYKYEIGNRLFYFIYYILDNHLSFLQLMQNDMVHLNQCLLLNVNTTPQCRIRELNPKILFYLHQSMVMNEHQYVTKMALNASMGGFWEDFTSIFWIVEYLQRPIYILNKISKCIMSQCGMDFQSIPLHIVYNFQDFKPIQYVNSIFS